MALILIDEPHPDIRVLLAAVVCRAGHAPIGEAELTEETEPALMIVEPAYLESLSAAVRLRRRFPKLPIIFASIRPPEAATKALEPVEHLLKPFRLAELEAAMAAALCARSS